jgi:hypothetical protein
MKHLNLVPALLVVAIHQGGSISSLIGVFREEGLGGYRACRKLIYRLESLGLLGIRTGTRDDRREKAVVLTERGVATLSELKGILSRLE